MKQAFFLIIFFASINCLGQNLTDTTKHNLSAVEGVWSPNGNQKFEIYLTEQGIKYRNTMVENSWAYFKVTVFPEFVCYEVSGSLFKSNFLGSKITFNGESLTILNNIDKKNYTMKKVGPLTITAESTQNISIGAKGNEINYSSYQSNETDKKRDEWSKNGGIIKSSSVVAGMNFTSFQKDGMSYNGTGASVSAQLNQFKLNIPEFTEGQSKWNTFVLGFGASLGYTSNKIEIEGMEPITSKLTTAAFNANLGYTLGIGRFLNKSNWKGAVIDFTYKPSYMMLHPSEGKATNQFNFVGFGVDINFSDFNSSLEKIAPKAGKKISFMILPQTDKTPLFISITLGLVWYE